MFASHIESREFEFGVIAVNKRGEIVNRATHRARQFVEHLGDGVVLEMVAIPGGTFLMGSLRGQGHDDERPQHQVTLTPFLMGKYPVTQEQWKAVMGTNPCRFEGARCPVENVSWHEAREFCARLSEKSGRTYHLPSEAQWEYACRARTTTPFYFGATVTTDLANFNGEFTYLSEPKGVYRHVTTEVGVFPPNAFGLYDMHGNLWEWCADPWHDDYEGAPVDSSVWEAGGDDSHRVVRGGSWHEGPDLCRCALRLKFKPAAGDDFIGFRVVGSVKKL